MLAHLRFHSVPFQFSPARDLRFCFRVLTASRAVTDINMLSHFMGDCAKPASMWAEVS
jgi:hypothetical protein